MIICHKTFIPITQLLFAKGFKPLVYFIPQTKNDIFTNDLNQNHTDINKYQLNDEKNIKSFMIVSIGNKSDGVFLNGWLD